ncbi:DUF5018 domain-containing protein [Flavobacterium pectinovorum]|uniref:DUF5018 domain-containing protein n=1 Tax=Flavobacterium pectinovorum TaxID=29533 RepID=UPI001FAC9600|nr:DUF5018 domain-containing protein [Flavobacterium pectinovorum]MCI9843380.1 hypothetical protein [Flavobacterium pectinovorum]
MANICLLSCTKEEDVTEITTDQTKNKIISYSITNPGKKEAIYSAVDHEAKTITAYLPAYYQLGFMEVAIELPQGTTISPSAEELVPVFSEKPLEYTVKAADGTSANYTLKVVIQYPDITLKELGINAKGEIVVPKINNLITVTGKNFFPSSAVTKLYLVDKEGNKVWTNYSMIEENSSSTSLLFVTDQKAETYIEFIKDKTTEYYFQLESYGIVKTMMYPVTFK